MAGEGQSTYDFDVEKQPATMLIQIIPSRYVKVNGHIYNPMRQTVTRPDGKNVVEWEYKSNAQVWVPPEVGNQLIQSDDAEKNSTGPMATLLRTRSTEEALPTLPVRKAEADTADGTNKAVVVTVKDVEVHNKALTEEEIGQKYAETSIPVEEMSYNKLQVLAKEKGMNSFGAKKVDLIAFLKDKEDAADAASNE